MRITAKITLGYTFITVLMLAICAYAVYSSHRHDKLLHAVLDTDYKRIAATSTLLDSFLAEVRNARKAIITKDNDYFAMSVRAAVDFDADLRQLRAIAANEADKSLLAGLADLHENYRRAAKQAVDGAKAAPTDSMSALEEDVTARIKNYQSYLQQVLTGRAGESERLFKEYSSKIILLFVASTLLGIITAIFSARSVNKPLRQINEGVARISKGDFSRQVDAARQDELGGLARSFNEMTERLRELDQLKADFVSYVSHELRTPLTSLREANNLLLEEIAGKLTEEQKELLLLIRDDTQRLLRMTNDLLDLSRLEAGMMPFYTENADFSLIVEDSIKSLAPWAASKEIELSHDVSPDILVDVDRDRIVQVLNNLVGNAIKFTPVGGTVRVSADADDSGGLRVVVEDSGIGIPREYLDNIFDKFHQVSGGGQKLAGQKVGSGLGLPIARHIIEGHGGSIMVESIVDAGTSFIFTLPASRVREVGYHVG